MEWNPKPLDPGMIKLHRRGKGEPLMLLHCLGMSWRFWDVLEPLTDRFELIAYSFPGHHDTPLPGQQYGVPELTAQHFAGTYPDMVKKLILADCTARYDDDSRANWPVRAAAARKDGVASLVPTLMKTWFSPNTLAADGPNVRFAKATLEACSGEGYALACEALATLNAREETKRVKAPTLILVGSEERKSFQDAADWMQATIPGSRKVTVPDAGHASVRDQPDFALRTLRDFLG